MPASPPVQTGLEVCDELFSGYSEVVVGVNALLESGHTLGPAMR
jgi:hypothetical protein